MRTPIQARLTLNNLIVLLLAMGLAGSLTWLAVERQYLSTQRENLMAQAQLVAVTLQGELLPVESIQPYTQTTNTLPGIHTRLLSESGAVVVGLPLERTGASVAPPFAEQSPPVDPTELLERPEIQSALLGVTASAIRRVPSAGNRRVLYAAAPILAQDGQVSAIAYLATPLPASGLPGSTVLQLMGGLTLALVLASLAGRVLARQIAQPLQNLAVSAREIANGNLKHRATLQNDFDELYRLGESFNLMAESLCKADQVQKAFLADVTHELRTPLTVIKGTIETFQDGALDDISGRATLLDSMQRETERLIRMVNDLLVLVRADAGVLKLNMQPVDLAEVARMRCETLAPLATGQHVKLQVLDETTNALLLLADRDRLSQVLENLLDNAIQHSPAGSTVTVRVHIRNGGVECAVNDQGAGIPARHLPHIFERFYRVDEARDRNHGGTGLGLAIARAIVRAHEGHISARSDPGSGSTFTFWLPAGQPALEQTKS
jgi:two-component system sensor histidine kinase BaeS